MYNARIGNTLKNPYTDVSYTPSLLSNLSNNQERSSQGKRQFVISQDNPMNNNYISPSPAIGQRKIVSELSQYNLQNSYWQGSSSNQGNQAQQTTIQSSYIPSRPQLSSIQSKTIEKPSQDQYKDQVNQYIFGHVRSNPMADPFQKSQKSDIRRDDRAQTQLQQHHDILNTQQQSLTKSVKTEDYNVYPYGRDMLTNNFSQMSLSSNKTSAAATKGIAGLRNVGNTCFMNSVLQCIMNTPRFNDCFIDDSYTLNLNPKNFGVAVEYSKLIQRIRQAPNNSSESTTGLKKAIEKQSNQFAGDDQQDAQEFMISLLEGLNQDMNTVTIKSPYKQMNDDLSDKTIQGLSQVWWDYLKTREQSIVQDFYLGQLLNKVTCQRCEKQSLAFDTFIDIQLSLSRSQSILDDMQLERLIDYFLLEEQLDEAFCSKCNKLQKSKRKFSIWRLPNILIFTIKRFNFRKFGSQKLSNKIKFPIDNLDLRTQITESKDTTTKNCSYKLFGVVNHQGSLTGGHYFADCLSPIDQRWYRFNDSNVSEINISDQYYDKNGSSTAYILFYKKKDLH